MTHRGDSVDTEERERKKEVGRERNDNRLERKA